MTLDVLSTIVEVLAVAAVIVAVGLWIQAAR